VEERIKEKSLASLVPCFYDVPPSYPFPILVFSDQFRINKTITVIIIIIMILFLQCFIFPLNRLLYIWALHNLCTVLPYPLRTQMIQIKHKSVGTGCWQELLESRWGIYKNEREKERKTVVCRVISLCDHISTTFFTI